MLTRWNYEDIKKYQHPLIRLKIGGTDGTTIDGDHIMAGSVSYKGGASSGGSLEPGGCIVGSLTFALYNYDNEYTDLITSGAQVDFYIGYGIPGVNAKYVRAARCYISEWTHKRGSITVTAYDALRKADKTKWTTWSFPMTVSSIIRTAANEAGFTVTGLSNMAGGSISVDLRTLNEDGTYTDPDISMTCRQAISEALKLSGNFGYCNQNGALTVGWFDWDNPALTIEDTFSASFAGARSYTGVQVGTNPVSGTSEYLYALGSNSFLTDDNAAAVEARLVTALVGHTFDCGSAGILQNPNLVPGDVVILQTPMGDKTVPITSITLKGSMIENISCEAQSYDEAEDERTDASTDAMAEQIEDLGDLDAAELSGLNDKITDINNTISGLKDDDTKMQDTLNDHESRIKTLEDEGGGGCSCKYKIEVIASADYPPTTIDEKTVYFVY